MDVKQIASELGVRYVLEGSFRRDAGHIRVNAQLTEAENGSHVWAARYDRTLDDMFAVQDDIVGEVVKGVHQALMDAEQRRVLNKSPKALSAWESYQRGRWHLAQHHSDENKTAQSFFKKAIELDPLLSAAYVSLLISYVYEGTAYGTMDIDQNFFDILEATARKAVAIDPGDADAQAVLALSAATKGTHTEAWAQISDALAANPNSYLAVAVGGINRAWAGYPAEGRVLLEGAVKMNPRDPLNPYLHSIIAASQYMEKQYEHALDVARRALVEWPHFQHARGWLAASLAQLGHHEEAKQHFHETYAKAPKLVELFAHKKAPFVRHDDSEHIVDGFRKAGWAG